MVDGKILTQGRINAIDRAYLSTPTYSAPYQFKVGVGTTDPVITDTDLENAIPISDGTVNDDGDNQLTGSDGGDNSTDNTTTFKQGAGVTDVTAQNLIANDTDASKVWTIADLDTNGNDVVAAQYVGLWLYIKDAAALAKLVSTGTAVSIRFRTNGDGATLYYELAYEDGDVIVGWNWLTSNTDTVADLTEGAGGAPSGDIDELVIEITTNNATDEFAAGDIVYDLLRQWETTDLFKTFISGYPTIDEVNVRSEIDCLLTTLEANGFPITELGIYNNESTPSLLMRDTFTVFSKSSTDEGKFIPKDTMGANS